MRTIIITKSPLAGVLLAAFFAHAAAASHNYVVRVDADLDELRVIAQFESTPPGIAARSGDAGRFLKSARDCESGKSLRRSGRRLALEPGLRCLDYTVDLASAIRAEPRNRALDAANVIVSPTVWMWRPRLRGSDVIDVRFELPDEVSVSVPWNRIDAAQSMYALPASPQSGTGMAVFGRFDEHIVSIADVHLRVVPLRGNDIGFNSDALDWVRETIRNITLAYGRFPNAEARVLLLPSRRRSDSPVRFGQVVRDGGETIELMVDPTGAVDEMVDNWTATHEFSHLMVPYIDRDRRWISEGFAQYYQNVLLARAGRYSEQFAWQKLNDGLERGRASAPRLSPNDAAESRDRNTRMKVYWAGAALALMADVELRRRSDNRESLDTVLGNLQQCCLPSPRAWSGAELLEQLDEFVDEPLFVDLYRRVGETRGFPEFRSLLTDLGVRVENGTVVLRDDAELAEIRATITGQRYTDEPDQ